MSRRTKISRIALCAVIAALSLTVIQIGSAYGQESNFIPGQVSFKAEYETVFFPAGLTKLYFDTTTCDGCRDSLPAWRFIGSLKVDSLLRNKTVELLTDSAQLTGVVLNSPQLLECISNSKTYAFGRGIPGAVPYDTLVQSRAKGTWSVVSDRAKFFLLDFDESQNADTVLNCLEGIPGLSKIVKQPRRFYDGK